jgi:hypothetical protein
MLLLANMKFRQQDANEFGDSEWVLLTDDGRETPLGITIFRSDDGFEVVTADGDVLGTAKTFAEAKKIALNLGC